MRNKIFYKFLGAFVLVILLFSLTLGSVFFFLFRSHTIAINRSSMEQKAVSIARSLSEETRGKRMGYGAYLNHLKEIAMAEVWIVDEALNVYTPGCSDIGFLRSKLPENADAVVSQVFEGKTTYGAEFSESLGVSSLTVGAPIYFGSEVVGAVLLHSPVSGIDSAVRQGLATLAIGCVVGLLFAGIAAAILSDRLARPLRTMKETALLLAQGHYDIKTGITTQDEIGQLARTMDVLAEHLEKARTQREQIDKMRDSFVANVSHELRTPIAILRGYLELLEEGSVPEGEDIQGCYRQMLAESRHMERLVNDLLELSRLQDAGFRLTMEEVDLCQIVSDAARGIRRQAQSKKIDLEVQLPEEECHVMGDYGRIRQMLMILMDNAVKFSYENGSIQVAVENNPHSVLRVTDHGVGIHPKQLSYIFDRFYKSNTAENRKGTGLGLAIAQEIAKRHEAVISVSSGEDGTVFEIRFPDDLEPQNTV